MLRQSSSVFLEEAGIDLGALSDGLQHELRMLLAIHGREVLKFDHPASAEDADAAVRVRALLMPQGAAAVYTQRGETANPARPVAVCTQPLYVDLLCPRRYLMSDLSDEEREAVRVCVDPDRLFERREWVTQLEEAGAAAASDCCAAGAPAMLQSLAMMQQLLNDLFDSAAAVAAKVATTTTTTTACDEAPTTDCGGEEHEHSLAAPNLLWNLLCIPGDVWGVIAEFLGPIDVCRLGCVCTAIYDVVFQDFIWEQLFITQHPRIVTILFIESTQQTALRYEYRGVMSSFRYMWDFHQVKEIDAESSVAVAPRRFPWSWAASYRYAALTYARDALRRSRLKTFNCERTGDRPHLAYFTFRRDLHRHLVIHHDAVVGRSIVDKATADLETVRDAVEAYEWCWVHKSTQSAAVKRVAQVQANIFSRNFNVALALLTASDFAQRPSESVKAKLRFPTTCEGLAALISDVRVRSLSSDAELEEDATRTTIVRVKPPDFRAPAQCVEGGRQGREEDATVRASKARQSAGAAANAEAGSTKHQQQQYARMMKDLQQRFSKHQISNRKLRQLEEGLKLPM